MKLKINFNIKPFLNYILVILVTSLGITSILVALPLTENISEKVSFNLITKDNNYWSKEYILKVNSEDFNDIQRTKDIIYKRLKSFDVEKFSIMDAGVNDEGYKLLRVVVNSTKDETLVKEILSNRFEVKIVTRKDDVDFFDEENQYAYLFGENYNDTDWDRNDFRNVYITELKTADNNYSNFAIFKPWPNSLGKFTDFLVQNKGEYIGVSTDGYVIPYLIPLDDQSIFAVPISTEGEEQIKALGILYNSGVIPVDYALDTEKELEPQIVKLDYIKVTIALGVSLLIVYAYLLISKQVEKKTLNRSFLATVLTMAVYLSALKLLHIPIDTFLLPILAILSFILVKTLSENEDSVVYIESVLILIFVLLSFFGIGYMSIFSSHFVALIVLSKLSLIFSGWYINKVNTI